MSLADDRAMPHSLEAERSVLGAILLRDETYATAAGIVAPTDFYRHAHTLIFDSMAALASAHEPIDFVSLKTVLNAKGRLDTIGGPAYLSALVDGLPRSTNIDHYARIVKEQASLRAIIMAARQAERDAYNAEETAHAIAATVQTAIHRVIQARAGAGFTNAKTLVSDGLDLIERNVALQGKLSGLASGFTDLDEMLCGLQSGDLIIVAGRPSMGKTAFAMNIVEHVSISGGSPAVFSLEMSRDQLFQRMLASRARIDLQRIRRGILNERDYRRISHTVGELGAGRLFIDDRAGVTVDDISAACFKLAAEDGLDLVVIDYLQLMNGSKATRYENRQVEVSKISRDLKRLAKELRVPFVVLSQLSRAPESRSDHRPMASDLRESGALEQDADVILFPYRAEKYERDDPHVDAMDVARSDGLAEIIVEKQRMGPTGTVQVAFLKPFARFENLAREDQRAAS